MDNQNMAKSAEAENKKEVNKKKQQAVKKPKKESKKKEPKVRNPKPAGSDKKKIKEKTPKTNMSSRNGMKSTKFMLFSIRNKIVACFLIPILFMIIIGISAYQKAASGMSDKYKESTTQTLEMATEYIDMSCNFIESESIKYATDSDLVQLMLGLYKNDQMTLLTVQNNVKTAIVAAQISNEFISDIHIIPKKGSDIISTRTKATVDGILEEYLESMEMDKKAVDKWIDRHTLVDEHIGFEDSNYILATETYSSNGGYLVIIDIKTKTIQNFLKGLDLGDGSIVGFVTKNGREIICENLGEGQESVLTEGEAVFYGNSFYDLVGANGERDGAADVTFNGKKYFFIYSKSSKTDATVCALVPTNIVTGQANEIRTLTIWLVILAVAIVLTIGILIVMGIQNNMKRISGKLEEVAKGDLTVLVNAKGRDEFKHLAGSATNMVANTKKLVHKVTYATDQLEVSSKELEQVSGVIDEYSRNIT